MISQREIEGVLAEASSSDICAATICDLLAVDHRRYAMESLADHGDCLTLADLADEVAIRSHETHITDVSADDVLEIYLRLYEEHVPELAAADLVEYDQDRDLVRRGANASLVDPVLDCGTDH